MLSHRSFSVLSCLCCLPVTLLYCGQTVAWIKIPLGMDVELGPGHIVLDGDPSPLSKRAQPPNFQPMSVVAKRMDESRCHLAGRYASAQATFYLMETQLPPPKRDTAAPPLFGPCLLWPNSWLDQNATWYGGRPQAIKPGHIVGPSCTQGAQQPGFGPCLP